MKCELCDFNNPKGAITAIVIRDQKLLVLRRNEEPHKGQLDLPGGYMNAGENPMVAMKREIKEELGVECSLTFIDTFPGTAEYNRKSFSVSNHVFLAELSGEILLNKKENSAIEWKNLREKFDVAFDSNRDALSFIRKKFMIDLDKLWFLLKQLDSSESPAEINVYKSMLNGYMSKKVVNGVLVGVGWIYPRQTVLRKQAVLEDIVVDIAERGKGYGEEITLDLMRWAKEEGVEVLELTSGSHRVAANKLYQKVGFKLHPTNHYLYKI